MVVPRWLCGCRRFPGKFTACSQITSMIHFVLREKITRAAPDEVCHQSKFWEPGNEARGVQLISQNKLMIHVVPAIKPVDNDAALEMDERQPHPRWQNLVERAVQLPAPCCAVRWLSCSRRDNAMMWWTLWVETSSFQTRLNTLAASLRRNIVDPGWKFFVWKKISVFFYTQLNGQIMLIPKKIWKKFFFSNKKISDMYLRWKAQICNLIKIGSVTKKLELFKVPRLIRYRE